MKCAVFYIAALACCIGLALADWDSLGYGSSLGYGYGGGYGGAKATYVPYYPGGGATGRGVGNGGFLASKFNVSFYILSFKQNFEFVRSFVNYFTY